jgi:hypothetical protein
MVPGLVITKLMQGGALGSSELHDGMKLSCGLWRRCSVSGCILAIDRAHRRDNQRPTRKGCWFPLSKDLTNSLPSRMSVCTFLHKSSLG